MCRENSELICATRDRGSRSTVQLMYSLFMIDIKSQDGVVQITIPTEGMSPEQVNEFVLWLRAEAIARHSKLTEQGAWELSEEVKAGWWDKNKQRFGE